MIRSGEVRRIGYLYPDCDCGRPMDVLFTGWKVASNYLNHETTATTPLLLWESQCDITRGPYVCKNIRPDAELRFHDGRFAFFEMDMGTENLGQYIRRSKVYAKSSEPVLWVTVSEKRLEWLRRHGSAMSRTALFTTVDRVKENPFGKIWIDVEGNPAGIGSNSGMDQQPVAAER